MKTMAAMEDKLVEMEEIRDSLLLLSVQNLLDYFEPALTYMEQNIQLRFLFQTEFYI